ncbi:MFS transporter [Alkalicoccobacillus murimartini]|uniref:PPP family 3-phenylpropionic acid transporter n=1 Tax=Alkalicoccobacillus murimartini TaxID=171685 RepID=A0ABT9YNB7_9BACI|nr:MFS transporter [Alkalicoccobacillus murimartini]MDQ0208514.1 PPP family 3-phenylpropionic acid transporter [Alkalicoccobacillus murimartini]
MSSNQDQNWKRSLLKLKLFLFFLYGSISILLSYFPVYFQEVGYSTVTIGFLMAGGPFVAIFANPFWAYWGDRLQNIRFILILMLIGNLIIVQFVFQLHTPAYVFIAMLVFFLFQTPSFSQSNSLVLHTISGTSTKFGGVRAWGSLGYAIMAGLAGPLIAVAGINQLWVLYSILLILTLLLILWFPKVKKIEPVRAVKGGYTANVLGNRFFLLFLFLGILLAVPNAMNQTFVSLYIVELGGSLEMIGYSALLTAIFELPVFLLLDRYLKPNKIVMIACLAFVSLLFALRWYLMSLASTPTDILYVQILHCITFGTYYYIGTTLTSQIIPARYRASGQALFTLAFSGIAGIIAGTLGGWLFQTFGGQQMYQVSVLISLTGMVGFSLTWVVLRMKNSEKKVDRHDLPS